MNLKFANTNNQQQLKKPKPHKPSLIQIHAH